MTKVLWATDAHVPYHSEPALELAMKIGHDFNPDLRFAGSDGLDFYRLSTFDKNPMRGKALLLKDEIEVWRVMEAEWNDACPNAKARYLLGNHEVRFRRYIWQKAPELYGLDTLKFENVLGLDALGIEYDDFELETNNSEFVVDSLVVRHGTMARKHSGWSVRGEMEKDFFASHMLTGHCHRGGLVYFTTRNGLKKGAEGFCLCNLNPPYITTGVPNWQNGIVLAETDEENVEFESIPFTHRHGFLTAVWRGKEYLAKDSKEN